MLMSLNPISYAGEDDFILKLKFSISSNPGSEIISDGKQKECVHFMDFFADVHTLFI